MPQFPGPSLNVYLGFQIPLSVPPTLPEELQYPPPVFGLTSLEAGSQQQQASCLSNKLKLTMVWKNGRGHLGPLAQEAWLSQTLIWICVLFQAPTHAAHGVFQTPQTIWILCNSCGPCFTPHLSITVSEGAEVEKKANSLSVNQAEGLLSTKFVSIRSSFV